MSVIGWIAIGAICLLVGFIILQRRRPSDADKVASALDEAFKKGVQDVKDTTKK